jgi:hypothetical protein
MKIRPGTYLGKFGPPRGFPDHVFYPENAPSGYLAWIKDWSEEQGFWVKKGELLATIKIY